MNGVGSAGTQTRARMDYGFEVMTTTSLHLIDFFGFDSS